MCEVSTDEKVRVKRFSELTPLIKAADGLSLAQVCAVTGLEPSTIQNWIKRGFVPRPERKRYTERHVARVMLIDALRDCLLIERVGELTAYINGNVDDTSDDVISEEALYDLFNAAAASVRGQYISPSLIEEKVAAVVCDSVSDSSSRERIIPALSIMVNAYIAGRYKREADRLFARYIDKSN